MLYVLKNKLFPYSTKNVKKNSKTFFHTQFFNKAVDLVNPFSRFININVTSKIDETCNDSPIAIVTNNLTSPMCNKIFNFNIFVFSINVDTVLENPED